MGRVVVKKRIFVWVLVLACSSQQSGALAAELVTTQTQTGTAYTSTQVQQAAQTSQTLIDTQNALLSAQTTSTASTPVLSAASQSLYDALASKATDLSNFNLLYGTSMTASGTQSSATISELNAITGQSGFNQPAWLWNMTKAAWLLSAIRPNATYLSKFNQAYFAIIQPSGVISSSDRSKLFTIVSQSSYNQSTFLSALLTNPIPLPSVPTGTATVPVFSPTSIWNTKLSSGTALSSSSSALVQELVANTQMGTPWINTTEYSSPYYIAPAGTAKVAVKLIGADGSPLTYTVLYGELQKGVPIPTGAVPSGGTDGTCSIYDPATDTLYEFWQLKKDASGNWTARWGGVLKNASTSSGIMPTVINSSGGKEYWGATATSLPAVGGLMLLKELQSGVIPHALSMAIPRPAAGEFLPPAQRTDGWYTGPNAIKEGQRFRFPANIYIDPNWSPIIKMMVVAIRDYGVIVNNKSSNVIFAAEDPRQYGTGNPYTQFYGGLELWDVMAQFPWSQMQALA